MAEGRACKGTAFPSPTYEDVPLAHLVRKLMASIPFKARVLDVDELALYLTAVTRIASARDFRIRLAQEQASDLRGGRGGADEETSEPGCWRLQ